MKKILALLLAAAMCFSLVACGGGEETPNTDDSSAQEQQLQNDNNEPEGTTPDVTEPENTEPEITEPEITEPQYETVEITLDNWQEYFEIQEFVTFRENGFGEIENVRADYILVTKEGITCDTDNCNITIEYTYSYGDTTYTVDYESRTIAYGETSNIVESSAKIGNMTNVEFWLGGDYERIGIRLLDTYRNEPQGTESIVVDVNVIRISGTLYCYSEH